MSADEALYSKTRAVDQNGRSSIPVEMRMALDIDEGNDEVEYELRSDGTVVLKRAEQAEP